MASATRHILDLGIEVDTGEANRKILDMTTVNADDIYERLTFLLDAQFGYAPIVKLTQLQQSRLYREIAESSMTAKHFTPGDSWVTSFYNCDIEVVTYETPKVVK